MSSNVCLLCICSGFVFVILCKPYLKIFSLTWFDLLNGWSHLSLQGAGLTSYLNCWSFDRWCVCCIIAVSSSADLGCLCTTEEARAKEIRVLWDVLGWWCQQWRVKCLLGAVLQLQEREHTHLHEADRGRGWSAEPLCQHQLVWEERRPPGPAELTEEPENSKVGWRLNRENVLFQCCSEAGGEGRQGVSLGVRWGKE